jgi:hypothetical protein
LEKKSQESNQEFSPAVQEVTKIMRKYKKTPFYYPFILDKDEIELVWHIERCVEQLQKVNMHIDIPNFNKSHLIVRNLDLLTESLGGNISMETILRVVYFDLEQSNKPRPRQDFSFTEKEKKKYSKMPSLSKFTKNNPYLKSNRSSYSLLSDFSLIQNMELVPKKIFLDNLQKSTLIAKQTK